MRVVVQRVTHASCTVNGKIIGAIDKGYLLLVGYNANDTIEKNIVAAKKISNLRIFEDENNKMNLNIHQVNGEILSISQFTLYADTSSGNRPSFTDAMNPDAAKALYLHFNETLRSYDINVAEGEFGADMKIDLLNDGPVTIILEF